MATTAKFSPFKITYLEMEKIPIKDGQLFFTTDTKEIFLDIQDKNTKNTTRVHINSFPVATEETLGGVKIDNTSIKINEDNIIYTEQLTEWDSTKGYSLGELVIYQNNLYKNIKAVSEQGSEIFASENWKLLISGLKLWQTDTLYYSEELVIFDNVVYICLNTHTSGSDFLIDKTIYWQTIFGSKGETGLSAYEIALKNGFKGTESDWLLSLKGETGSLIIQTEKKDILINLLKDNWESSAPPFYQIVENEVITNTLNPRVDVIISTNTQNGLLEQENFGYITRVETRDGEIIFYCYQSKPNIDLTVAVEVI